MRRRSAGRTLALLVAATGLMAAWLVEPAAGAQLRPSPGEQTGPGATQQMRPGMMDPGMRGGRMGMMVGMASQGRPWLTIMLDHRQELGLSAEQVGKLFDLRERFQEAAREKAQAIGRAEAELEELLGPRPIDLAAVEARLKRIEALRTELQLARLETIEEGKRLLTEEQQAKLVQVSDRLQSASGMGGMGTGGQQ